MHAQLWNQLDTAMDGQLRILNDLLEMERKKTEVLLVGKPTDLEVLIKGEQLLTWQLARSEEQRQSVQEELAGALGLTTDQVTLNRVIAAAPPDHRDRLEHLASDYHEVCAALDSQNARNSELIKGALAYFDFAAQVLRGSSTPGTVYSASGPTRQEPARRDPRYLDNRT